MAACKYCGKPAGIFRTSHAECERQHVQRERDREAGRKRIAAEVCCAIRDSLNLDTLEAKVEEIERESSLRREERNGLFVAGWERAVEHFLDDSLLDEQEEQRLATFKERFALSQDELDGNGAFMKTAKAAVLRKVLDGVAPRILLDGNLPINLQKAEQIVWVFPNSQYLEDKTRRQFVGGSRGVSVRLMKGVYYRVGAFKGQAIERRERVHVDTGLVAVTNKNIYFVGPQKSVRLPYSKIVSFEPFSDGIGIMRDAATAKPQIFITGDGWFTYNLVTNLSQISCTAA